MNTVSWLLSQGYSNDQIPYLLHQSEQKRERLRHGLSRKDILSLRMNLSTQSTLLFDLVRSCWNEYSWVSEFGGSWKDFFLMDIIRIERGVVSVVFDNSSASDILVAYNDSAASDDLYDSDMSVAHDDSAASDDLYDSDMSVAHDDSVAYDDSVAHDDSVESFIISQTWKSHLGKSPYSEVRLKKHSILAARLGLAFECLLLFRHQRVLRYGDHPKIDQM
eukprot:TRINITY_DN203_c0_g2_i2.p1 TRINITY_DN203_c0_g2~~TRINITY_DN203_c0_g2_i2.p1  ORF type:complete len:220 (-),score=48.94 TRINITY_DN203_c0_g2_i2:342-1001(-)